MKFEQGLIEFRAKKTAPKDLCGKLSKLLSDWTGTRWMISLNDEPGDITLAEQDAAIEKDKINEAGNDPLVRAVLTAFPTAQIKKVIEREDVFEDIPITEDSVEEFDDN